MEASIAISELPVSELIDTLKKLCKDICPSEWNYDASGNNIHQRFELSPKTLRMTMCSEDFLRASEIIKLLPQTIELLEILVQMKEAMFKIQNFIQETK